MDKSERSDSRGIIELDQTGKITKFWEKPAENETDSRLASVVFYCLRREVLPILDQYLEGHKQMSQRSFGQFIKWAITEKV